MLLLTAIFLSGYYPSSRNRQTLPSNPQAKQINIKFNVHKFDLWLVEWPLGLPSVSRRPLCYLEKGHIEFLSNNIDDGWCVYTTSGWRYKGQGRCVGQRIGRRGATLRVNWPRRHGLTGFSLFLHEKGSKGQRFDWVHVWPVSVVLEVCWLCWFLGRYL